MTEPLVEAVTGGNVGSLWAAAMPPRYRLMLLLAAWCAMRYGELTELRRKDIDVVNGVVRIRRAVVRVRGEFLVGTPRTDAGTRDVAIPPHLMPAVRHHLAEHTAPGRESLLFPAKQASTWPSRRSIRSGTRPGPRPGAVTSAGTTSGIPARSWPRRPGPRSPS